MIRVGINGFARIGRQVCRAIRKHHAQTMQVVAVNDVGNRKVMTHRGRPRRVRRREGATRMTKKAIRDVDFAGRRVLVRTGMSPAEVAWRER